MVFSQSKTITGTIKDETGLTLPGVTIQIKNTEKLGAVSDFDGKLTITIPS